MAPWLCSYSIIYSQLIHHLLCNHDNNYFIGIPHIHMIGEVQLSSWFPKPPALPGNVVTSGPPVGHPTCLLSTRKTDHRVTTTNDGSLKRRDHIWYVVETLLKWALAAHIGIPDSFVYSESIVCTDSLLLKHYIFPTAI